MRLCRICGNNDGNAEYLVKEMLIGTREEFRYLKCGKCGCLQIIDIPVDMSKYYPSLYRTFYYHKLKHRNKSSIIRQKLRNIWVRQKLRNRWKRAYIDRQVLLNRFLIRLLGKPCLPEWMIRTGINTKSKILDIGCGEGRLLFQMSEIGFKDLTGIDRYMKFEHDQQALIIFTNQELTDLARAEKKYDLIMLNHSLEHMSDQFETLRHIRNLLNENGSLVIRIPVVSSFAWRHYGTNWFSLDAPRHFYLHTNESMRLTAEQTGFAITRMYYDASPQTLWASEQYMKDIPSMDQRSFRFGLGRSIFSQHDIDAFVLKTQELNKAQDGDQACFILKKK